MIFFREGLREKLKAVTKDNYYIVADFNRTFTKSETPSSWSAISKSGTLGAGYVEDRQALFEKYRPYEIDLTLDEKIKSRYMTEWWEQHVALFVKHKATKNIFELVGSDNNLFQYRRGAREFLELMHHRSAPVLIVSAGVGDIIENSMRHNGMLFTNIEIVSNFMAYRGGVVCGLNGGAIHSLNKDEACPTGGFKKMIASKSDVFVLGDSIDDIKAVPERERERAIKIGFCEANNKESLPAFREAFNITCTDNTSFEELLKALEENTDFTF